MKIGPLSTVRVHRNLERAGRVRTLWQACTAWWCSKWAQDTAEYTIILWGNVNSHVAEPAQWLSRPRPSRFARFWKGTSQIATAPVSVWRRFMVLGPSLEFLILGNASLELRIPDGWAAHRVTRTVLS